jgi:Preprotein translocase subunit SecD
MKTTFRIMFTVILISLLSWSCATKENYELKMTIVPQPGIYPESFFNFGETGDIIIKRLIKSGIDTENINLRTFTDRMVLTIAKADTSKIEVIEKLITVPGKIGFWETFENSELIEFLVGANRIIAGLNLPVEENTEPPVAKPGEIIHPVSDTSKNDAALSALMQEENQQSAEGDSARKEFNKQNPLFGILIPRVDANGQPLPSCLIGLASRHDTAKVIRYLGMKELKYIIPRDLKLFWSRDPYKYDKTQSLYELHAIKNTSITGEAPLDGEMITSAKAITNKYGSDIRLNISMNAEGAKIFARMTHDNINRSLAITIDGYVRSYPRVMMEITGGNLEITGNFSLEEAQYLSAILNTGGNGLPLKLQVAEKQLTKLK